MSYRIYEVPNGRTADFSRGYTGDGYPDECRFIGEYDSVEDCREAFKDQIDLAFDPSGDLNGAIFDLMKDRGYSDEVANAAAYEGVLAAEKGTQNNATEDDDPSCWSYDLGDLRYLRVMVVEEVVEEDIDKYNDLSAITSYKRYPSNVTIFTDGGSCDISTERCGDYGGATWTEDEAIADARSILREHGIDDTTADHYLLSLIADQFPRGRQGALMMKPRIKRPTAAEIAAVLSPSTDTEFVEIAQPVYAYLKANLPNDDAISAYVSNRISSELVRLSKMKDGTGGRPHKNPATERQKAANRANAVARWEGVERVRSVKVRVYDEPHAFYMSCANKKQERTRVAGDIVMLAMESDCICRPSLLAYCESHREKPQRFVTLPEEAVNRTRELAAEIGVPFTKVINYLFSLNR